MKKFSISILGIIGILVLVVFASGCTSSNNTTANSSSSNGQSTQLASSSGNPTIKIISTGPWMGSIQDSTGSRSVQGSGSQTYPVSASGVVGASIQKDNSKDVVNNGTITPNTSTLTVQIVDSTGKVVETQSTSADAGVVTITHSF